MPRSRLHPFHFVLADDNREEQHTTFYAPTEKDARTLARRWAEEHGLRVVTFDDERARAC